MTKQRKPPRWVAHFVQGLERTGEVRAAAAWAGIDHSTAYQRRKAHPDFAAAWDEALAAHKVAKGREEEDVLAAIAAGRGEVGNDAPFDCALRAPLRTNGGGQVPTSGLSAATPRPRPRAREEKNGRWTASAEKRFFAVMADQANVRKAAEAAGFSTTAIYQRRLKNKVFAAAWDAAVETGKARLQMLLIKAAEKSFDPELVDPGEDPPKVSASEAIRILQTRAGIEGARERDRHHLTLEEEAAQMSPSDVEELRERLLQKLERLRQRRLPGLLAEGWQVDGEQLIPPGWVRDAGYVAPEVEP